MQLNMPLVGGYYDIDVSQEKEDPRITEKRTAFHNWKNNDEITKLVFNFLREKTNEITTRIVNNAASPDTIDHKIYNYYACAAKLQLITEILTLSLDDKQFQDSILREDKDGK
jgi:hypothetical protein